MGQLDLEILTFQFQTEVDFLNWKQTTKHFKNIYNRADHKNIICFQIRAKLKTWQKYAHFANFGPPF